MFDKFTNRAKQVIKLAKKEAQRMNHNYLGTEHILLGLLKLGQGIAVNVLRNMNIDYEIVRQEVEKLVGFGPEIQLYGDPALTGKVKKVIEYANEEAATLNHNYVGTEHLLLGLLRQTDGVAAQVLENLNINLKEVRKEVLKELESFNLQLPPTAQGVTYHQVHRLVVKVDLLKRGFQLVNLQISLQPSKRMVKTLQRCAGKESLILLSEERTKSKD